MSYPVIATKDLMIEKAHGSSEKPVMQNLRFNVDWKLAVNIVNFNRDYAENKGYSEKINW